MGMYTGLRFKGVVKEEFRNEFEDIALNGNWEESSNAVFAQFGSDPRADFIPCGALSYMPDEWETEPFDKYYCGTPTDGFDRTYDKNSGRWTFQCSLKNYNNTIENFLRLLPYFIESVEHAEVYYEEWCWSRKYELVCGEMIKTSDKFVQYGLESDEWCF